LGGRIDRKGNSSKKGKEIEKERQSCRRSIWKIEEEVGKDRRIGG
jgi:hypothetical protein